jgi:hypothetical protein
MGVCTTKKQRIVDADIRSLPDSQAGIVSKSTELGSVQKSRWDFCTSYMPYMVQ